MARSLASLSQFDKALKPSNMDEEPGKGSGKNPEKGIGKGKGAELTGAQIAEVLKPLHRNLQQGLAIQRRRYYAECLRDHLRREQHRMLR